MTNGRAGRTLYALLSVVVPAIAVAELGLIPVRALVPASLLQATNDVSGNYLQTLGTIYAVLLAFVVFVVWTQFNDARQYVEREANELLDLFRTAGALPASHRARVRAALAEYVDAVLTREWPAMVCGDSKVFHEVGTLLDRVWDSFVDFDPRGDAQSAIYGQLLARANDLSDVRANRLTTACLRVPLALRVFLHTGAFMTIGSMYLFAVESWGLHALMVGAMAGMLSHLLYIIRDLDNCFDGEWQVPRVAFERVQRYFAESSVPEAASA
jgi:hypothetical protein